MAISIYFAKRFNHLRNSHNLSIRDIALMLNVKSSSNITFWEKGKSFPSLEVFNEIITLFAVSSDWLLGYTNEPYKEKIISEIENEIFSETIYNNGHGVPLLREFSWMNEEYWNPELRSQTYSLPVRANIIFLLHNFIANQRAILAQHFTEEKNPFVTTRLKRIYFYEALRDTDLYAKKRQQQDTYTTSLHNLIAAKESAKPIFDIQTNM